jgi:phytoene dehydrogenase-like protein
VDVATPLTYHRYCNVYKGAYMSFLSTAGTGHEHYNAVIDGIDGLFLAGQWTSSDAGLPIALLSGKFAVQRIYREEKRRMKG